ncbi:molybdopterin-binding protein [Clostridiales bacterium PH28_bin88]|nr:molybdopterin-binding protein [Clostridiales bacterium PH28_bin88]
MELNLLEKTELWVEDIFMNGANLTDIASVVAETLNLERKEVLVVDVRDNHITLDILRRTIQARDIAGKEGEILDRLAHLPGVRLGEDARIHSEGILGLIALPPEEVEETFRRSEQMVEEIRARVARRVKVFPSGFEVKRGMIRDTNSPMIAEEFRRRGYNVATGGIMDDDEDSIAMHLLRAVEEGYGLVITTGGVGAEDKDRTVEGLLRVDPMAATSWIVKYQKGSGRHQKAGVRIAVGVVGETTIIALPGPNDEVKVALEVLFRELPHQPGKTVLAERIAGALREVLKAKNQAHESCHFDHHYMCHHSR